MDVDSSISNGICVIRLRGRFDFSGHRAFREAAKAAITDAAAKELQVDLRGVEYLDSSALGMLLLTLENARSARKAMSLSGAHGVVKQVLDIANFQKLFAMK